MSSDRIRNEQFRPIRVRPSQCDDSLQSSSTRSDYEKITTRRSKANTSDDANPSELCIHSEVETQVIADLLSRHTGNCEQPAESTAREHVFQVQQHETRCRQFEMIDPVRDCPVTNTLYVTIKEETERDKLLQQLSEVIKNGWPKDVTNVPELVRPWWTFRDELAIFDGVVYKGPRVVIPTSMRGDMLKRLHVSHQGIEATLRRARQTMFWHGMAVDVKQNIANCNKCRKDTPEQTKETLHSHSIPDKPWKKVAMDIFTHKSINYLVITDYFSDYFEFWENSRHDSLSGDRHQQAMLLEARNPNIRTLSFLTMAFNSQHVNLRYSVQNGGLNTRQVRHITPSRMAKLNRVSN